MNLKKTLAITSAVYILGGMSSAHAYLDPGTGSLVVQGLIATIAAASAALGLYWHNVKNFFKRDRAPAESTDQAGDSSSES